MKGVHVWGKNLSNARKWSASGTVWIGDTGHSGQFVLPKDGRVVPVARRRTPGWTPEHEAQVADHE